MIATHKENLKQIEETYKKIGKLDDVIFEAVGAFFRAAKERLDLSLEIEDLEKEARQEAARLGEPQYSPRQPALIGGALIRLRPLEAQTLTKLMTIWLQRYGDFWKNHNFGPVQKSDIADHGFRGGTGVDDVVIIPSSF
jgi:hypothetical protein